MSASRTHQISTKVKFAGDDHHGGASFFFSIKKLTVLPKSIQISEVTNFKLDNSNFLTIDFPINFANDKLILVDFSH